MSENDTCPICGSLSHKGICMDPVKYFYNCPVCGRFEYSISAELTDFNLNHLGAYLAYNGFIQNGQEYRYFTTMSKEKCDEYRRDFENGDKTHGHPVHLSAENVENWCPATFTEKIDHIVLYLIKHSKHMGGSVKLSKEAFFSSFFIDRYDIRSDNEIGDLNKRRTESEMKAEAVIVLDYLLKMDLIISLGSLTGENYDRPIILAPKGYARVDELQKKMTNSKNVLVAMKFGKETTELREAIRKGISEAKFNPIFIDEVQHNDFITPELLKYIKDSKFVVADLSHQNNGAYFEEGFAIGLGKPVIQLCKSDVKLHFDVAQKNTIMWDTEDDITNKLKNRIIATID